MAVFFPTGNIQTGDLYPDKDDPKYLEQLEETNGIVYQYDGLTNSWNIVGPDNIATTDWVLGQLGDDKTDVEKSYELISATNQVGVLSDYDYVNLTACNTDADAGIRNSIYDEGLTIQEAADVNYGAWINCSLTSSNKLGNGQFAVFGIDTVSAGVGDQNAALFSRKYEYVKALLLSEEDRIGKPAPWLTDVSIGDTIEINYRGASGNLDYIIYRVESTELVEEDNSFGNTFKGVFVEVQYLSSNVPQQDFRVTGGSTYYEIKTYRKAYSTSGGIIDGPVHVYHTDTDAIIFSAKDDSVDPTFKVDTINNTVKVNSDYDDKLVVFYDDNGDEVEPDPTSLVTLGHLDVRFGGNDALDSSKVGPFLSTKGGTLTSELTTTVGRKNSTQTGTGNFDIRGKTQHNSNNTNNNLFVTKHQGSSADYISYNSKENTKSDGILNKGQIDALVKATDDKLDDHVKRAGDTMSGALLLKESNGDIAEITNDHQAAHKHYVDNSPMGPVANGQTNVKGQFYWYNNNLYINPY